MFVIAVETAGVDRQHVPWTGRRHDDDATESTGEQTAQGLFDAVFYALHDGEQVAIGFDCPLSAASPGGDPEAVRAAARATEAGPGLSALRWLVTELGTWRPWTIVTTSVPRWRATTSVLVWQSPVGAAPRPAIDAFFATVRDGEPVTAPEAAQAVVNLAAAAALDSDVTADPDELTQGLLRVDVTQEVRAAAR